MKTFARTRLLRASVLCCRLIFALSCIAVPAREALALSQLSRACRFDTIPTSMQVAAAKFLYALGAPAGTYFLEYAPGKDLYWIFESITTDYFEVRYYLYAESHVYVWDGPAPSRGWPGRHVKWNTYSAGLWRAQVLNGQILSDSRWKIFMENRGFLYSVRAGEPQIYTVFRGFGGVPRTVPANNVRVVGQHAYYDPKIMKEFPLQKSQARDCNLNNWGFGYR